jgi:hypothetical protein
MSIWVGLLVGIVFGVRSMPRKRRQGLEAREKGLYAVRKVVIVLIGMVILAVLVVGLRGAGVSAKDISYLNVM